MNSDLRALVTNFASRERYVGMCCAGARSGTGRYIITPQNLMMGGGNNCLASKFETGFMEKEGGRTSTGCVV